MGLKSLYEICVNVIIQNSAGCTKEFALLPDNIIFDLYFQFYVQKKLCILYGEFSNLEIFSRMLKITNRRLDLLKIFQGLMNHETHLAQNLVQLYCQKVERNSNNTDKLISLGLKLGGFLSEAGWFDESEKVLLCCQELCLKEPENIVSLRRLLECCHKLLHSQAGYCNFDGAEKTYKLAKDVIEKLNKTSEYTNLAGIYSEFSILHFSRSEYDQAYRWSAEAMRHLGPSLPHLVTIDTLRQASKACVVKRQFSKAGILARQAMILAKQHLSEEHPKFSDCLLDFGFYLINFDIIWQSVIVYERALDIRTNIFGKQNVLVAIAHEDLAYALYVREYSSGNFLKAREHADRAIEIMQDLLPSGHLMLASVKRVKALILEEIALDSPSVHSSGMSALLEQAEELHKSALKLAMATFGERNVQTAKHFGNLGRLYQSMRRFADAELMHLKAIAIKEELLGPDDYEVGLSIGHLASLYNYHMNKYQKAEELYFRSIVISLKLFGQAYSGLEYDYRGLVHVYHELEESDKAAQYTYLLNNWKLERSQNRQNISVDDGPQLTSQEITKKFFEN